MAKKGLDHGLVSWILSFFFQNTSRRPLPASSETVLYRCFKEYFCLKNLKISQENFHNFIINFQVKGKAQFVSEAATGGVLRKKVFLKIFQKSKENIYGPEAYDFIKKERLWHRCFPVNFAKLLRIPILKNIFERLLLPFKKWPLNFDRWQTKPLRKPEMLQAATTKNSLHQSYKSARLLFLWQCFLIILWDKH